MIVRRLASVLILAAVILPADTAEGTVRSNRTTVVTLPAPGESATEREPSAEPTPPPAVAKPAPAVETAPADEAPAAPPAAAAPQVPPPPPPPVATDPQEPLGDDNTVLLMLSGIAALLSLVGFVIWRSMRSDQDFFQTIEQGDVPDEDLPPRRRSEGRGSRQGRIGRGSRGLGSGSSQGSRDRYGIGSESIRQRDEVSKQRGS
ncbi:MAG: hypothetical protein ACOCXA_01355 [Planctomycetota bacterium]